MSILLVANINSSHTRKWALALKSRGLTVGLFSIDPPVSDITWSSDLDLVVHPEKKESFLPKKYFTCIRLFKKALARFKPHLVHSHFLTHYSFVAGFSGKVPHIATAWGSDVFAFPKEGLLQRMIFVRNLKKARMLISTSANMAR